MSSYIGFRHLNDPFTTQPTDYNHAFIEVHKSASSYEISKKLEDKKIIASATRFRLLGKIFGYWQKVKVGEYEINSEQSGLSIFKTLSSGISVLHPITIKEGQNIYEIAAQLQQQKICSQENFLKAASDPFFFKALGFSPPYPANLEGYLFPNTYYFTKFTSPKAIVHQMVKLFQKYWLEEYQQRALQIGFSRHEVIILASMIEKETSQTTERPIVSSVFHNRLQKNMKLQSDPTTIYGIWDKYDGKIYKIDLTTPTPYNTYTVKRLPQGPISNPGKASIEAALYPAQTDYLFFVSRNDGTHVFSNNYKMHAKAVQEYQIRPKKLTQH